ncbi:hypothetical protein C8R45DRAFT_615237 [Mycena sanguinolenta]|nr:hypothetical protein C8R45DRAFT_615237 [Mycena sanguinolenta]
MTARRRSFHLNANASAAIAPTSRPGTLNLNQGIQAQAGALTIGLLGFARQASTFAFTLLGGCAPGVRPKTKHVPKALLVGSPREAVEMLPADESPETTGEGFERPTEQESKVLAVPNEQGQQVHATDESGKQPEVLDIADAGAEWANLRIRPRDNDLLFEELDHSPAPQTEKPYLAIPIPPIAPPIAFGLGLLIPSASTNELRLLSPLESRCASPKPEFRPIPPLCRRSSNPSQAELRANLVSKVAAFTAARLSGSRRTSTSLPPHAASPSCLNDSFAQLNVPATSRVSFVSAHPAHLYNPSLQFSPNQPQSPTPHPRPGRPCLRQRTVFFAQVSPRAGTPPPEFWSPHPAGSRSCAIPIKAPPSLGKRPVPEDKENQVSVSAVKTAPSSRLKEGVLCATN